MIQQRMVELSKEEVNRILCLEEDWTMDKKGKDIAPSKLSHSVSAFANTNGGELYIGLSHYPGEKSTYYWDGFSTKEEFNQIIDIITSVCPGYDDCSFEFCDGEDCGTVILHVTIQKTQRVIRATNNTPYLRVGVQNIPQTTQEQIRQLEYDKGIFSYEDEFTACSYDEIKDSPVLNRFIKDVVPRTSTYDWLKSQYLMNSNLKINVAGVLLYSVSPQAIIPKRSAVRILRYHSDMKEGSRENLDKGYPISIEGDIYTLISEAVIKTKQIVEETNVVGLAGMESKNYPDVTLHEIITNAVLHRDYSIAADIQIRIFTDRLEIESPGKLPGHITIENILREQFSRNAKIVRLISKFPYPPNKDAGEGLNTAFDAMASMDLKKPQIVEKENSVLIIIKHERLADHEVIILDYLKTHSSISNMEGRKLTGITDTIKMKDVFIRLRTQGSIELISGLKGNASRWQLTSRSRKRHEIKEELIDIQDSYLQEKMEDF
jgi:ATP-dependent DNA helicase RecG